MSPGTSKQRLVEWLKWNLLLDLTYDDVQTINYPLGLLNGNKAAEELAENERETIARDVLLDLYDSRMVVFFRATTEDANVSAKNPQSHLLRDEVLEVFDSLDVSIDTWLAATERGAEAGRNAPDWIVGT